MKDAGIKRCRNPICGGNGNCAVCPKRMSEQFNSDAFEAVAEYEVSGKEGTVICSAAKVGHADDTDAVRNNEYAIAIDLGTTTLAFVLVDKTTGEVVHTITMLNSQRKYGADVLSRIQASVDGEKDKLRKAVQKDLCEGIDKLLKEYRNEAEMIGLSEQQIMNVEHIVISGNTTMIHLLMGYDCSTLGVYPFRPVNTALIKGNAGEIIGYNNSMQGHETEIPVTVLPAVSAFVGGDIVSGLYVLDFAENDGLSLFIDLGTNGEIALGNRNRILTTSVAAGPAFEGGNISCGTGSVAGAICAVEINNEKFDIQIKTIKDAPPCGICGTGVIETVAELLKCGFVDETGLLTDEFFDGGFLLTDTGADYEYAEKIVSRKVMREMKDDSIVITQQDIRWFQLAKAAVRTGIEILIKEYGITVDEIDRVYIAGGFGYYLNIKKAAFIGLIPPELTDKAVAVGNTSLAGAVKYLSDKNAIKIIQRIKDASEDIILANDDDFQELYLKNTCLG